VNNNTIIVYDTETTGLDTSKCEIIEIAAIALDPRTLEVLPNGTFEATMKALRPEDIEEGALKVNKRTREEISTFRHPKQVWGEFIGFVSQYNKSNQLWSSPVAAGHNIIGYDNPIVERYRQQYSKTAKLWHPRDVIDTKILMFFWFENLREPTSTSLDSLRDFFSIDKTGAHGALKDCKDVVAILTRFMRLHRRIAEKQQFKGAFAEKL
jgi:DNA polymerase III epsilon subunit-like protein